MRRFSNPMTVHNCLLGAAKKVCARREVEGWKKHFVLRKRLKRSKHNGLGKISDAILNHHTNDSKQWQCRLRNAKSEASLTVTKPLLYLSFCTLNNRTPSMSVVTDSEFSST